MMTHLIIDEDAKGLNSELIKAAGATALIWVILGVMALLSIIGALTLINRHFHQRRCKFVIIKYRKFNGASYSNLDFHQTALHEHVNSHSLKNLYDLFKKQKKLNSPKIIQKRLSR